jgi:hypothetical protein
LKPREWCVLALLASLCGLGLIVYANLPDGHTLRIVCALLPLALGFSIAIAVAPNWSARLACVAGSLLLAALAWCFVPAAGGLSLWSAYREPGHLVAQLESLEVEDLAGYRQVRAAGAELQVQFPELGLGDHAQRIDAAGSAWRDRAGTAATAQLEMIPLADGRAFLAGRPAREDLGREFPELRPQLEGAEKAWVERCIGNWDGELAKLTARDKEGPIPPAAYAQKSARLRQLSQELAALAKYSPAQERLLAVWRRVFQARLEIARQELQELLAGDRFQAAADAAGQLEVEWKAEAHLVGMADELDRFHASYAFLADLARRAGRPDPQ